MGENIHSGQEGENMIPKVKGVRAIQMMEALKRVVASYGGKGEAKTGQVEFRHAKDDLHAALGLTKAQANRLYNEGLEIIRSIPDYQDADDTKSQQVELIVQFMAIAPYDVVCVIIMAQVRSGISSVIQDARGGGRAEEFF